MGSLPLDIGSFAELRPAMAKRRRAHQPALPTTLAEYVALLALGER